MSAPYASEELVAIYLVHYDETDENGQLLRSLLYDGVVNHADYKLYQLPFSVMTGHYGILFHIKSEADGRTLCIDNLSVSGYGLKDVALLNILSPALAEEYDNPQEVTVRLRNNGRVTVYDVPLVLTINDKEVQREEVPTLESGADINYTFSRKVDLHEPGTYHIVASVDWVLDQRPGNNKQEITRVQSEASDLALTVLTEPLGGLKPYSEEETVAVRIENRGRATVTDVPINAIVNGTQRLNGVLPAIESGRAIVYTFAQTVDMSKSAWYEFEIYLSPATPDNNPANDTLYSRIDGRYTDIANEPETLAEQLILYPNPVHTTMHITVPQGYSRLEIYALNGKRYLNRTVSGGTQLEIPADGYPEGMYILKLSGMSGEKTVKWIKVR
ncbi:MAG: T9SS type A sorting domain-containing protein [Bacteroidales bacterium]|nr:T9SS type A sorting domain-containing protein [Bacteroidales bacterium]